MVILPNFRSLPCPMAQLSLASVLQCGQSFRWSICPLPPATSNIIPSGYSPTHEYRLCLHDRVVCLRQSPDVIFYRSVFPVLSSTIAEEERREAETLVWLRDYFQLDIDLVQLYEQWAMKDPVFHRVKERFCGIRILRQDPFENLISFICSSNNHIGRISKMVKSLCKQYSPVLLYLPPPSVTSSAPSIKSESELEAEAYHPFPPPSVLATPEVSATLRSLGFGYRADFIQKTARMLVDAHGTTELSSSSREPSEQWLNSLRSMSTPDARQELMKLMGVGRKVADCVLLMSLDKREVVPVDTHVYQIAVKHYGLPGSVAKKPSMTPKIYDDVNTKLTSVWGEYAGWAHSVLFTSDLKSFASHGMPTPSLPRSLTKDDNSAASTAVLPITSSPSPSKRKRGRTVQTQVPPSANDLDLSDVGSSMAERVKRRRRGG